MKVKFRCYILAITLGLISVSTIEAAIVLVPEDLRMATRAAQLLSDNRGTEIVRLLEETRMPLARLEEVISIVYLILAEIKIEEAEAQIGQRPVAEVNIVPPEGIRRRSVEVVPPSDEDLRKTLQATKQSIKEHLNRYFDGREEDANYREARSLIESNRADVEIVFNALQGQKREER